MLEQSAYVAQIIGVILVIGSLIYVAKQLRQNTDAIHAQSRQAVLAASHTELYAELENPDVVISIVKEDPLTAEDHVRLAAWLYAALRTRQFAWLQWKNGVIDDSQWNTEISLIRFFFDSQRVRDWWSRVGHAAFGNEYADFVDGVIRESEPTETLWATVLNWSAP